MATKAGGNILFVQLVSTGGDGLVKLWNSRDGECTASYEEHQGKVWALAAGGTQQSLLATGGADAAIIVWRDCTAEDEAAAAESQALAVGRQQQLANALQACPASLHTCYFECRRL